jgi:GTP:adenosylcobinamide-phosphate guanylyltransferase
LSQPDYIIVQAGGRGSRLETLTNNKPKALVPVENLPMIFHLFKQFPKAHFIVIADYKKEVLVNYLRTFASVKYDVVFAKEKGTCSGINEALTKVPDETPFLLTWCDLVLPNLPRYLPAVVDGNFVGISKDFECRWSFKNNQFVEVRSSEHGVAGLFLFKDKSALSNLPDKGEFVRFLSTSELSFERLYLEKAVEVGTMLSYFQNELNKPKSRPFNKIEFKGDIVLKYPVTEQGETLAKSEIDWYKKVKELGFTKVPAIYGFSPLVMEKVKGENVFNYGFLTSNFKRALLKTITDSLIELHGLMPRIPASAEDCEANYVTKTFQRLEKIRELVPFAQDEFVTVNHTKCTNIFFCKDSIIKDIRENFPSQFSLIHGDCTFHNIMISSEHVAPVFIDPRGYFGKSQFYGDEDYDWAKLYYSLVGDYDQFNKKNFSLEINADSVELFIVSNNWNALEDDFFSFSGANKKKIKLLHALIWLSLTTYAWEDYDSVCGAFYKGLLVLQDYLDYKDAH